MKMLFLEAITVGLPFCAFKIFAGLYYGQYWLLGLGLADTVINLTNIFSLLIIRRRIWEACFMSLVIRLIKKPQIESRLKWEDFGNSLDMFLSFVLVAIMIGGNHLQHLPPLHLQIWNISVILNVIGAGLGRITHSIRNLHL